MRKSKIFITTLWVLTLKYIWRISILSTRWYLNNIYCNTVCWNDRACCTCIACVCVCICVWEAVDRFAGSTLLKHDRAIALYERPGGAKSSITIRNTRNYATSEKVKSQGKCAVAARQPTCSHPPASREFLLTFSGRSASAEIRVSRAKIEELSQTDVSIIDRKICLSTHYSDKRYVFNFKKYLILLKNSQNVSHQAVFLHSL